MYVQWRRLPLRQREVAALYYQRDGTLFDDLFLETLDKRDHVALFGLGHLELR